MPRLATTSGDDYFRFFGAGFIATFFCGGGAGSSLSEGATKVTCRLSPPGECGAQNVAFCLAR
jgi:hypothetical protein